MRGISEESLLEINPWEYNTGQELLNTILNECRELNPWQPIDENTPKDRRILLLYMDLQVVGEWDHALNCFVNDIWPNKSRDYQLTHWKELPEPPK